MFNFEVLNLEVDFKEAEQKLLELFFKLDHDQLTLILHHFLYNNQINARALIGQSAVGYCASKSTEYNTIHLLPKWRRPRMVWVELHENEASRATEYKRFVFDGGRHSWQFTHWKRCESIKEF